MVTVLGMARRYLTMVAAVVAIGCSDSLSPEDFYGIWGDEGVRLTLSPTQARLETSCWAGDLAIPLQIDGEEFTAVGTLLQQGGAAGGDESRIVTATGRLDGDILRLTIDPASVGLGPWTLQRDAQVTIPGCP
jgi:hypothetical protein